MSEPSNHISGSIGLNTPRLQVYGNEIWRKGNLFVTLSSGRWHLYIEIDGGLAHLAECLNPDKHQLERWVSDKIAQRVESTGEHLRKLTVQRDEVERRLATWNIAQQEVAR